jgi:hypothetical protein
MIQEALEIGDPFAVEILSSGRVSSLRETVVPKLDRAIQYGHWDCVQIILEKWEYSRSLMVDWASAVIRILRAGKIDILKTYARKGFKIIQSMTPLKECVMIDQPEHFLLLLDLVHPNVQRIREDVVIGALIRCVTPAWKKVMVRLIRFNKGFSEQCYNSFCRNGLYKLAIEIEKSHGYKPLASTVLEVCEGGFMRLLKHFVEDLHVDLPRMIMYSAVRSHSMEMVNYVEKTSKHPINYEDEALMTEALHGNCFQIIMNIYQKAGKPTLTLEQRSVIVDLNQLSIAKLLCRIGEPFFCVDILLLCITKVRVNFLQLAAKHRSSIPWLSNDDNGNILSRALLKCQLSHGTKEQKAQMARHLRSAFSYSVV